jgi:hypothetical protein
VLAVCVKAFGYEVGNALLIFLFGLGKALIQ